MNQTEISRWAHWHHPVPYAHNVAAAGETHSHQTIFFPIMAVLGWLHTHCSGEMCSLGIQSGGRWQTGWRASRRFLELGITLWNSSCLDLRVKQGIVCFAKNKNKIASHSWKSESLRLWACEALCRALWGLFCCLRGPEELHVIREFINTALEWASRLQAQAKILFNLDGCLSPRKNKTKTC